MLMIASLQLNNKQHQNEKNNSCPFANQFLYAECQGTAAKKTEYHPDCGR